jgi:integrase
MQGEFRTRPNSLLGKFGRQRRSKAGNGRLHSSGTSRPAPVGHFSTVIFSGLCRNGLSKTDQPLSFPPMARIKENQRAKMFIKRLKTVGITGISMHSYRYAWAERAKTVGMPERFAQQALGHSSKAFVRAYSKKARVVVPSLEDYEAKVVPLPMAVNQ